MVNKLPFTIILAWLLPTALGQLGRSLQKKEVPPQKTTVGFTCSCSSPTSPGLDGSHPVYIYYSFHFPGMTHVYESVTKLDAKSTGRETGEDTQEIAQKIQRDLDAAVAHGHITQDVRNKIKVQNDTGGPGNTRARIVATGADHVNFGVTGDSGKIRWQALTDPVPTPGATPGRYPVTFCGSGTFDWPAAECEVKAGAKVIVTPIKPNKTVPAPFGHKKNTKKFKNSQKVSKLGEFGIYVNEDHPWHDTPPLPQQPP
jgi:hypothetical protein